MKTGIMSMKKQSIFLSFTLATILSISPNTLFAKGDVDGGGGDARCAEYLDLTAKVAVALKKIGQEKISKENPIIKADEIWNIRKAPLKCLPVKDLDRQARSYPDKKLTNLDVEKWEKMNRYEKIRLAMHELSVLARYENDGEYFISDDIKSLLKENPNKLQMDMYGEFAKDIIKNKNGTITLVDPFAKVGNKFFRYSASSGDGLCMHLGLTNNNVSKYSNSHHKAKSNRELAVVNSEGELSNIQTVEAGRFSESPYYSRIRTITCKASEAPTPPEVPQAVLDAERAKHNGGGDGNTAEELNLNNADDNSSGVRAN